MLGPSSSSIVIRGVSLEAARTKSGRSIRYSRPSAMRMTNGWKGDSFKSARIRGFMRKFCHDMIDLSTRLHLDFALVNAALLCDFARLFPGHGFRDYQNRRQTTPRGRR